MDFFFNLVTVFFASKFSCNFQIAYISTRIISPYHFFQKIFNEKDTATVLFIYKKLLKLPFHNYVALSFLPLNDIISEIQLNR
jgi:hypothetical protein